MRSIVADAGGIGVAAQIARLAVQHFLGMSGDRRALEEVGVHPPVQPDRVIAHEATKVCGT